MVTVHFKLGPFQCQNFYMKIFNLLRDFFKWLMSVNFFLKIPSLGFEGSESGIGTPVRIFENDDGCDDNDMVEGIEADLEIDTGKTCNQIFKQLEIIRI